MEHPSDDYVIWYSKVDPQPFEGDGVNLYSHIRCHKDQNDHRGIQAIVSDVVKRNPSEFYDGQIVVVTWGTLNDNNPAIGGCRLFRVSVKEVVSTVSEVQEVLDNSGKPVE